MKAKNTQSPLPTVLVKSISKQNLVTGTLYQETEILLIFALNLLVSKRLQKMVLVQMVPCFLYSADIYSSNFDVRYATKITRSYN